MIKRLLFFATRSDIINLLECVEAKTAVKYVVCDEIDTSNPLIYQSAALVPNLGIAIAGYRLRDVFYLVFPSTAEVQYSIYSNPEKSVLKHIYSQEGNDSSIVFAPGGIYKETAVIAGEFNTVHANDNSQSMMRIVKKCCKEQFKKVKLFYVGPEAYALWRKGFRLTPDVRSPRLYDLSGDD